MNNFQRVKQAQACHIKFKGLIADGIVPNGCTIYDYAFNALGTRVESLKTLQDWQLNALRDRLEGKENKGLKKLLEAAAAAGIGDLTAWMRAQAARGGAFRYLSGYSPETLPANLQWRLVKCLETRARPGRASMRPNKVVEPSLF